MGELLLYFQVSLDGIASEVEQWGLLNDELFDEGFQRYEHTAVTIFGGNTIEGMADYWKKAETDSQNPQERDFAAILNGKRKITITNKPLDINWNGLEEWLMTDPADLKSRLQALKHEVSGTINVESGIRTWRKILDTGLVDTIRVGIHPVLVGKGESPFSADFNKKLRLKSRRDFSNGVIMLDYAL